MRIAAQEIQRESNFNGESFQGRLNTAKLGGFMQNLIKNYNDPAMATLREWVSNAWDSHQRAGQTKPVRVTLPTKFSTQLIVEDFGVGMSFEEVRDVYAVFLTSTKDADNDGIGGFGIGGKSALAIADQYSMVAIKDGLKNIFIFERSSDGGLDIKVPVMNQKTDEPNGVRVSVAVDSHWVEAFKETSVNNVLRGWSHAELELVGRSFVSVFDNAIPLTSGVYSPSIFEKQQSYYGRGDTISVLVGPVHYWVAHRNVYGYVQKLGNGNQKLDLLRWLNPEDYTIQLPIGSVTFPSSREVIEPNEKNMMVLARALSSFLDELSDVVQSKIEKLETLEEAWKLANSDLCRTFFRDRKLEFNGRDLANVKYSARQAFRIEHYAANDIRLLDVRANDPRARGVSAIEVEPKNTSLVVKVDSENAEFTPDTYRKYIRPYVLSNIDELKKSNGFSYSYIVVSDEDDELHKITSKIVDFAELRKASPTSASTVAKRAAMTPVDWQKRLGKTSVRTFALPVVRGAESFMSIEDVFSAAAAEGVPVVIANGSGYEPSTVFSFARAIDAKARFIFVRNLKELQGVLKGWPEATEITRWFASLDGKAIDGLFENLANAKKLNQELGAGWEVVFALSKMAELDALSDAAKIFVSSHPSISIYTHIYDFFSRHVSYYMENDFMNLLKTRIPEEKLRKQTLGGSYYHDLDAARGEGPAFFTLVRGGVSMPHRGLTIDSDAVFKETADYVNWSMDRFLAHREAVKKKLAKKTAKAEGSSTQTV